jgi:hypothetical protein
MKRRLGLKRIRGDEPIGAVMKICVYTLVNNVYSCVSLPCWFKRNNAPGQKSQEGGAGSQQEVEGLTPVEGERWQEKEEDKYDSKNVYTCM